LSSIIYQDGPTATSVLRQFGCDSIIIGVTGNVMPDDVKTFIDHGADAVFGKPVSFDDFESFLRDFSNTNNIDYSQL
jgi:osomolarity two-component system response regulator SKN7